MKKRLGLKVLAISAALIIVASGIVFGANPTNSENVQDETIVFDTEKGTYPSIFGEHKGNFTPKKDIEINKVYTYPCPGTGGHPEYVAFFYHQNETEIGNASWKGYREDWHNITFDEQIKLSGNETYKYLIKTGSYPQIIHKEIHNTTDGTITCTQFKDANGKIYYDWIPAIKLIGKEVGPEPQPTPSVTWEGDVRITATGAESIFPTLGVSGSTIHLAWVDQRDGGGNREIYYNRSTDSGTTWQASDTRISNHSSFSIRAAFAVNGDVVHLFWRDDRDGNYEVYLIQSTNGGVSWGPETRITDDPGYSGCPFPVVNGDTLNLFWRDDRLGTFKIYHKRSIDAGANWSTDTLLTPDGILAEFPFPAVCRETLHLVWRDTRDGNAEIYYKRSTDGGVSWTTDERLTNNLWESEHPKLVVQGDNLHLVWRDNRDGNYEVYYKRSTDSGQSWSEDLRLTNNPGQSLWPVLGVSSNLLSLLWCDDRDETQALYYMFSSDGGNSWSVETRLSDCILPFGAGIMGAHPIMVTKPYIHVVFNDDRTGENEIYYKRGTISCQ